MNIYLNEELLEINSNNNTEIAENINSELEEEIIEKIYLDEVEVSLNYFLNNELELENFDEIKFITKDISLLIEESLEEAEEYLPKLKEGLKETAAELRKENYQNASELLNISIDGLEWYLNILNSILDLKEEDALSKNLKNYTEKFNIALNRAMIALKKEEYNDLADLLEAEIVSYLSVFERFNCQIISKSSKNISKQKKSHFYNSMYKNGGYKKAYFKHYSNTPYFHVWKKGIKIISNLNKPKIIEIACGPGQFAEFLFDNNFTDYQGIDFSSEAIKLAKNRNETYKDKFEVENALNSNIYSKSYNIVVMFEFLEHIEKDIEVISKIKKNSNVLFSVPNYDSESHVRYFRTKKNLVNRYNETIKIENIFVFNINKFQKIYLVYGFKK